MNCREDPTLQFGRADGLNLKRGPMFDDIEDKHIRPKIIDTCPDDAVAIVRPPAQHLGQSSRACVIQRFGDLVVSISEANLLIIQSCYFALAIKFYQLWNSQFGVRSARKFGVKVTSNENVNVSEGRSRIELDLANLRVPYIFAVPALKFERQILYCSPEQNLDFKIRILDERIANYRAQIVALKLRISVVRNKRTPSAIAADQSLIYQNLERATHGDRANAILGDQFWNGGQLIAGLPFSMHNVTAEALR